ncbi:MAG: 3-hydroxyacyl-CoA dehydrogenase NAD-binding domain-containing protein [Steroidobacteraceae bacterium]
MTTHSETVRTERQGLVGVILIDNPPVNAIAPSVRDGIAAAAAELDSDPAIKAIVLHCLGNTFMAGADLKKIASAPTQVTSADIIRQMEDVTKPIVAALHGNALGGGLEFGLGCHYRCAAPSATLGLPEVNLGLIPGAGGTQRLPRLVGVNKALDMILSGKAINAREALESGLVDRVLPGQDVLAEALAYARELIDKNAPVRKTREIALAAAGEETFAAAAESAARSRRGEQAPLVAITAVRAAFSPFQDGIAREKELFFSCRDSAQSRALRHLFAAERQIAKIPGIEKNVPTRQLQTIGVVGAGTMGRGIAVACLDAGFHVVLVEMEAAALNRALAAIAEIYKGSVAKGRMTEADMQSRMGRLTGSLDLKGLDDADLVIEAVFEDLDIKQRLFADLDRVCKPSAILATNTSALSIDSIAESTARAEDVIGLHFFSPAHVMRLLEVVRGSKTAPDVIATAMVLGRRLRKLGVLAGNCDGFIGNRMLAGYRREAEFLLLEGATPEQVDAALVSFGMPMGPHTMGDMAGLDISTAARQRRRREGKIPADPRFGCIGDALVAQGRLGQKRGRGFYRYEKNARAALPDPEVHSLIQREAERLGIARRSISDEEVVERCILPLINEGARILEEGIALRPGDIDVVWTSGYGFPRFRGGPMCYADEIGLPQVLAALDRLSDLHGPLYWTPSPLLQRLVSEGKKFGELN